MNTGHKTLVGTEIIIALDWIKECNSNMDETEFDDFTDNEISRLIARNYSGGINQFRLDYLTE